MDRTAVIFTRRRSMLPWPPAVLRPGRLLDVGTWTRCGSAVPLSGIAVPRRISPMTWQSRERSPVCRPVAGPGTAAAQHTNVHNLWPHDHPPGPDPLRRLLREFRGPFALSLLVAVQTCVRSFAGRPAHPPRH